MYITKYCIRYVYGELTGRCHQQLVSDVRLIAEHVTRNDTKPAKLKANEEMIKCSKRKAKIVRL